MQPIDPKHLAAVCGGAGGAILGSVLQSAGPILSGVANIIGASKSGGGGGGGGGAPASAPAPAAPAPSGPPPSGMGGGGGGLVSVAVSINGVQTSVQA